MVMLRLRRFATAGVSAALVGALSLVATPAGAALARPVPAPRIAVRQAPPGQAGAAPGQRTAAEEAGLGAKPALCDRSTGPAHAHCYLSIEPAPGPAPATRAAAASGSCAVDAATGWTPCNIQMAYGLTTASSKDGKGNLVAVVDAYDDPNIATDLAEFRSMYGLPACTTSKPLLPESEPGGGRGVLPDS